MEQQHEQEQGGGLGQVFAKLCAVEALLKEQQYRENSKALWDVAQIADYFHFTEDHVRRVLLPDPRFPAPVDIQGRTGNRSKNLYIAGEVVRFCLRWRKVKPRV